MPIKSGKRTPKESVFARSMAKHDNRLIAMQESGLSAAGASRALARPQVQSDIRREQLAILNNELLPAAIGVLATIIADPKASERGKLTAVKIVLDRALGGADASESKEPHEMTSDEIQKRLDALRREASDRARVVIEHEPGEAKAEPSAFD